MNTTTCIYGEIKKIIQELSSNTSPYQVPCVCLLYYYTEFLVRYTVGRHFLHSRGLEKSDENWKKKSRSTK